MPKTPKTVADIKNLATLGLLCKQQREARGLTLREVRKELGMSHSTLSRFERGVNSMSVHHVIRLANWLGVPLNTNDAEPPDSLNAIQEILYADPNLNRQSLPELMALIRNGYGLALNRGE